MCTPENPGETKLNIKDAIIVGAPIGSCECSIDSGNGDGKNSPVDALR